MRVRKFVIAAILAIATLAAAIVIASNVLISRFDAIEVAQASDKAVQALRALEADLNQLAVSARDYGEWDDAHEYVSHPADAFIHANFSYDSLDGMQVDEVILLAPAGDPLFAARTDDSRKTLLPGSSAHAQALARQIRPDLDALRQSRSYERIVETPQGLMAFAAIDIARSNRTGRTGATLFFARYLHEDEIARMRATSHLPVSMAVGDRQHTGTVVSDDRIAAYAPLVNWRGERLATLSVTSERTIGMLGRHTTLPLMAVIALFASLSIGVFMVMVHRLHAHWATRLALNEKHRRMLAALDEGILLVDPETGQILECNDAVHRLLGYTHEELPGIALGDIFVGMSHLPELVRAPSAGLNECRMRTRAGELLDAEVTATEVADDNRRLTCIVARDVSGRRQAEQSAREDKARLAHIAEHDTLTGLPNRLYLQTHLPAILERLTREERSLALLYIDLDHFKHINDSRGHGFGDEILKIFAARLRNGTSGDDIVLRTGGDEFIVAAALRGESTDVRDLGQRLLNLASTPISHEDIALTLTASIGISLYPQDGPDCESLLKHADIALYRAKGRGRHCYQVFTSDMSSELYERVVLEQALRRAIDTPEIYIELQPVFDLRTGALVSFESLARWQHPEMGKIPPSRFIPVAESSGLITALGAKVVREVLVQLRAWQGAGVPLVPVAVNVAPSQLERTDFTTFVHEAAMEYDIDPQWLAFEVTESAWLQDSSKHIVAIDTLRHAGSRIYIDDFGTGFSNLNYLKSLPIDVIKIDRSFVSHVDTDSNDAMIVGSIVAVARQLRLDTVAEGIETESQAQKLRELGCTYGQGYLFGRPALAATHDALLAVRRLPDELLPQIPAEEEPRAATA